MNLSSLPGDRRAALLRYATTLFNAAWRFDGGVGDPPPLSSLSQRNLRRWLGAALACEQLITQRLQDTTHSDTIINSCIRALEALKGPVHIK